MFLGAEGSREGRDAFASGGWKCAGVQGHSPIPEEPPCNEGDRTSLPNITIALGLWAK